jgi:hypothetical protein
MFEFANPGFLAAGTALVSSPIIIHLINRIRYKRVRWAAMEFLLKSQKKNRRRLIIEQLILLALRCLLVILALMLVAKLLKISFGSLELTLGPSARQKTVHIVLLDDSPSMLDEVDDPQHTRLRTCFDVAKEVILTEIVENAKGSTTPQDLELVVLSQLSRQKPGNQFKNDDDIVRGGQTVRVVDVGKAKCEIVNGGDQANALLEEVVNGIRASADPVLLFHDLREDKTREKIKETVTGLKCGSLHTPLLDAVTLAQKRVEENKDTQVIVHLLSDFRAYDWAGGRESRPLSEAVVQLAKSRAKVNLIDTAHPYRKDDKTTPAAHDNICLAQLYPEARVVAANTLVRFSAVIHNYSDSDKEVRIALWDPESGKRLLQFEPGVSIKVPRRSGAIGEVTYPIDILMPPRDKDGFFRIAAELELLGEGKLQEDGVPTDNVAHAAVFVRTTVPILIVDGEPERGKQPDGDSYHIEEALKSNPGAEEGLDVEVGDAAHLDQPNLSKYLTIFLVNVGNLSDKQLKNLESYVWNGGSVAIFMGKGVSPIWYNEKLYKNGKGLLPVELADTYTPPQDQPPLTPNLDDDQPKILVREDNFPNKERYPIFGELLKNEKMRDTLKIVPIWRYYEIKNPAKWKPVPGEVDELATMPNLNKVGEYGASAKAIREELKKLAETAGNEKFSTALKNYAKRINDALGVGAGGKAKDCTELADVLGKLKTDIGDEEAGGKRPSISAFLDRKENQKLRTEIDDLWRAVRYGSPLMLSSKYNRGRVITVMTTAGKEWSGWPALASYVSMLLEMHSYMTSLGEEGNLSVGTPRTLELDNAYYDGSYKVTRPYSTYLEKKLLARKPKKAKTPQAGAEEEKKNDSPEIEATRYETWKTTADANARQEGKVRLLQVGIGTTFVPGFYRLDLIRKKDDKNPEIVEERGFVFNVDTAAESDLQRMSRESLLERFQGAPADQIELLPPFGWGIQLQNRESDFSQSPWFFLLFLLVLVAEQAMAVHLSFHLRDTTASLPTQAVRSQAMTG